ncbi:sn-glycerol-3-phosphate ABC transporter substrate-binding protein UgpB [Inquilinus sp. CAU 1745]|uniref:sn-glycerol-3-phosphate ABC transporter substrate-binding protein UgpB n=1 Tax=Inquilinus sp. CAU 1745 TaxID=3140369 RepID=UPI00325A67E7
MTIRFTLAASAIALLAAGPASAQTEIQWWHAMGGALGEWVDDLAQGFNESQDEYVVVPTYKGSYPETMTAAIAAFRSGEQPHIVQVFEVGTATMMAAEGAVYPVYQLMQDTGTPFDPSAYLPAVAGYYTTSEGEMLSLPFNSSTPVMYYNKDAFEAAGLDPESPPETWPEFAEAAAALVESGATSCGFTTAWQEWVQLENLSAWHNVPIGTLGNGFGGLGTELLLNSDLQVMHISALKDWMDEGLFKYGGRQGSAEGLFFSGECGLSFSSSAAYAGIAANAGFDFGIGMLPYWPDVEGAPQNSIIGGGTLWVLQGRDEEDYAGVAEFFNYLSSPEVQADSHARTGYLPITTAAYELAQERGLYEERPGFDTSIRQLTLNPPTENSKGLRFGNYVQIREIINEELEAVWAGDKEPQAALDAIVERGNELLRQFEEAHS